MERKNSIILKKSVITRLWLPVWSKLSIFFGNSFTSLNTPDHCTSWILCSFSADNLALYFIKKQAIRSEFYLPFFTPLKLFRIDSNVASFPLRLRGVVPFMVKNSVRSLGFRLPNYGTSLCQLFHLYLMSSTSLFNACKHSESFSTEKPSLKLGPFASRFPFSIWLPFLENSLLCRSFVLQPDLATFTTTALKPPLLKSVVTSRMSNPVLNFFLCLF